ncbi:MAG: PAS domain-containing protein [Acidimicrobiia bacterium]|nr:PAS domain-containing protein [Acidimicrobiia bacterium]
MGNLHIGDDESGADFTVEDEETLKMFAAQAAMAIANARRYGEEQRAKADLEAFLNTSPVGVLVLDAHTRGLVSINHGARRIIGLQSGVENDSAGDLGMVEFRRMDGTVMQPDEVPIERVLRTGETVYAEELVIVRPSGDQVTTLIKTTPIRSEDDQLVAVVATIQDITPLEELERLRYDFLGMVSHELRTPLTSIKGSAATVLGAPSPLDPAEIRQFSRIIEEQADHMRDLINNLLDLSRIEAGTLSVVAEPTDAADVVDRARKAFLSGGYRNSIEVEVMPGLPRVAADGRRIVQVLHNLFSNASTYSREWSPIRVTALLHDALVGFELLERIRTDFPHPGHRPVRPARPGHRQGVRARSRRLCCKAVRPGRTRGQDRSSAPSGCRLSACWDRAVQARRPGHQLPGTLCDRGRRTRPSHSDRAQAFVRALPISRTGADPRPVAEERMEPGPPGGSAPPALVHQERAPEARGRR